MTVPSAPGLGPAGLNAHARLALGAARRLGYQLRLVDVPDGYLMEICDGRRTGMLAAGSASPYALNDARAYCLARDKAFTAMILDQAGIPAIPTALFFLTNARAAYRSPGRERGDAIAYVAAHAPVFVKPNQGARGAFAEIIATSADFADYLDRLDPQVEAVVVQPVLRGLEYRVLCLNGRAIEYYPKALPQLVGDGVSPLAALAAGAGLSLVGTAPEWAGPGTPVDPATVVPVGAEVVLIGRANRSTGGGAATPPEPSVPQPLAEIALKATAALGLVVSGVDVFALQDEGGGTRLVVIEVNASPGLETFEAHDQTGIIDAVWGANFRAVLRAPGLGRIGHD